jgi:hypothetical protein
MNWSKHERFECGPMQFLAVQCGSKKEVVFKQAKAVPLHTTKALGRQEV